MRKSLHKLLVAVVMLTMLHSSSILAQVVLNSDQQNGIVLNQNVFTGIKATSSFAGFNHFNVNTKEGVFTEITANGYGFTWEEGAPKLPVMRRLIEIPVGARPEVVVVSYDVNEYTLSEFGIQNKIMPTQPAVAKSEKAPVDFVINHKIYSSNKFIENTLASIEIVGTLRSTRMARLEISPVEYNPTQGTIRVYSNVVVDVRFTGADYTATTELKTKTRSPYFGGFDFLNKLPVSSGERDINFTRYPVKMVIVSDPMFQATLQPFIEWKIKKGFDIVEAYTNNPAVGTTKESIKSYLNELYDAGTAENPAPSFVLFVGDVAQIPAYSHNGQHVTDLYYCEYTGDDLPEVFYGRFSATSVAQLQPQIDKTHMYEKYQFPDPSFLDEVVMVAGMDNNYAANHGNGQIKYATTYYFNQAHGLNSHVYNYPASGSSASAIRQDVSNGVGFGNYTAHGSPKGWSDPAFEISHIPALQNYGKYPLLVGNCCLSSKYEINSFGEELLRAEGKGAVGYIGASNSTYWNEDFYFGVGFGNVGLNTTYEGTTLGSYDRVFHDHGEVFEDWYTTQAQMMVAGNLAVTESGSARTTYYWQVYNLMGDPSLSIYFGVPNEMTASYDSHMLLQSSSFTVNTDPYAYVAISKEGILHGSALANGDGVAEVLLDLISAPGEVDIIITAQNRQPHIGTILIDKPEGPYIVLQSHTVNDESGNNNQLPEHAEHFGFNFTMKNVGNSASELLTANLTSTSPYIEIVDGTETWSNIGSDAVVSFNQAFEVLASEWLPDQHEAHFDLEITNGTETWNSSFSIKLNAPLLLAGRMTIDDSNGNDNGRLDPGEEVIIAFEIKNDGGSLAAETEAYLFADSEWVDVSEIKTIIGDIEIDSSLKAFYNVSVSADSPTGAPVDFYLSNASGVYSSSKIYSSNVGMIVEDFETGSFTSLPWVNTSDVPWTITNSEVHSGTYAAQSGQIPHNTETTLQLTMDVATNDVISFACKASSESSYDVLRFYIDDTEEGSWSGEQDWEVVSFDVTPGTHTFKWTYKKDPSASSGLDAGFIDDIIFPSLQEESTGTEFAVKAFAYPAVVCDEGEVSLFAFVENPIEEGIIYSWSPAEMFPNPAIHNPVVYVNSTTLITVAVANGSMNANTEIEILDAKPETPTIEVTETELISSAVSGNQWYNNEGAIEGAVNQIYVPVVNGHYYVITTLYDGCESDPSEQVYFTLVGIDNPEDSSVLNVYPNPFRNQLNIDFDIKHEEKVKISLLNLVGQEIRIVEESIFVVGTHRVSFNANGLMPGIYFLKMESKNGSVVKKVVVSK